MFFDSEILEDIREKYSTQIEEMHKPYQFQENGGKVKSLNDSSWNGKKELYDKPELPLVFSKRVAMDEEHIRDEAKYKSEDLGIGSIKYIEKPDTKLNSLASMAARKVTDKPSRN